MTARRSSRPLARPARARAPRQADADHGEARRGRRRTRPRTRRARIPSPILARKATIAKKREDAASRRRRSRPSCAAAAAERAHRVAAGDLDEARPRGSEPATSGDGVPAARCPSSGRRRRRRRAAPASVPTRIRCSAGKAGSPGPARSAARTARRRGRGARRRVRRLLGGAASRRPARPVTATAGSLHARFMAVRHVRSSLQRRMAPRTRLTNACLNYQNSRYLRVKLRVSA